VFTHFANADGGDLGHARLQLERFHEALHFYERRSLPMPLRHAANSGAILQLPEESVSSWSAPGSLLYGSSPSTTLPVTLPVQQALALGHERGVLQGGQVRQPDQLRSTWGARVHDARDSPLPVGYGDGYMRALSRPSAPGDRARGAPAGRGPRLHGSNHGRHRLEAAPGGSESESRRGASYMTTQDCG